MQNDEIVLYKQLLACRRKSDKKQVIDQVLDTFENEIMQSPAYQENSEVNGIQQPIVATRKDTAKCNVTVLPGSSLYIGDLVKVFDEYWICMSQYIDEYGMQYGELWMCNQIFTYQDRELNIIKKYAILDDGSYSNGADKAIMVTGNKFNCYISLDDESRALYIDKRLAVSVIKDVDGEDVLEVGKIKWIDIKSKNFGYGSHLMVFGINEDAYSAEYDNISKMICDYKKKPEDTEIMPPEEEKLGKLIIIGKPSMRIGSTRTYNVKIETDEDNIIADTTWRIEDENNKITIFSEGLSCKVNVPENSDLIGSSFILKCKGVRNNFIEAEFKVEVV